jgi:hypothetical protein
MKSVTFKNFRSVIVASELKAMFDKINQDCKLSGESVVEYSDIEYYAEQIRNIYGYGESLSIKLATQLSKI